MKIDEQPSYLSRTNLEYLENLYEEFLKDPSNLDQEWARFFEGVEFAKTKGLDVNSEQTSSTTPNEIKIHELIRIYRDYGHLNAKLDPLELSTNSKEFESFKDLGLAQVDKKETFTVAEKIGMPPSTLSQVIDSLEKTYCGSLSLQAAECSPTVRKWFWKEFETPSFKISKEQQIDVLKQLARTESLEKFIHTRYVGVKRFSIEGCDSLIPMLEYIIEKGTGELGVQEITIGMAHRGRVNVLANFMNKALELILAEFNGHMGAAEDYDADVKYHMGFSSDKKTSKGKSCHVSLAFNPSHLEAVSPVVCGMARAKQRHLNDSENRGKVIPILIHGDAAVIGQGVVSETFQLSQLDGYKVGGSIHIIMNNQVGFTTNPSDSRSTQYASDIAKTIKAPVLLVNADDPEACIRAIDMALRFRQEFKQDVLIDLIGYRRFGHNEGDEPAFTQPLMYSKIKKHPTVYNQYAKDLANRKIFSNTDSKEFFDSKINNLQEIFDGVKTSPPEIKPFAFGGLWEGYKWASDDDIKKAVVTKAKITDLNSVMKAITTPPEGFNIHSKIKRLIENRQKMFNEDRLDWGTTELLCYGSLIKEGTSVRLSGQDCIRGTFTHRHSMYFDTKTGERYSPLMTLSKEKEYCVYNSPLSEMAVLGFEYGNSISDPNFLTIWEAQFGDFANGGQIIIDQFITSGEAKWFRSNGLVLLLPHGYEGQGPEHSSARLERFLQMAAQNNMQICNFTTPAQLFHAMRRQIKRNFRKPLVVMSPKSLLRHPRVTSTKKDLTEGAFMEVIADEKNMNAKRVVMCSGKLYYDLIEAQEKKGDQGDIAIVRIEQLYPFPQDKLSVILASYKNATEFVWAQEEPQNMGAYWFIAPKLKKVLQLSGKKPELYYAGRTERSSPATGAPAIHTEEQNDIINSCLNFQGVNK